MYWCTGVLVYWCTEPDSCGLPPPPRYPSQIPSPTPTQRLLHSHNRRREWPTKRNAIPSLKHLIHIAALMQAMTYLTTEPSPLCRETLCPTGFLGVSLQDGQKKSSSGSHRFINDLRSAQHDPYQIVPKQISTKHWSGKRQPFLPQALEEHHYLIHSLFQPTPLAPQNTHSLHISNATSAILPQRDTPLHSTLLQKKPPSFFFV